jgi:NAD(P)-dependent dehydrogenase (short-subunit alcohol dehydrogenase family)
MRAREEQTILVTGSTSGLGRRVAQELATGGATVLVHGRNRERAETAAQEIREGTGNDRLHFYVADFSSLAQVRRLAEEIERQHERLDVLVNNAGIIGTSEREESEDGYELSFAVNYLAHFLLTTLLLPLLRASTPARVVNVASGAQTAIDFEDVMLERRYDPMRAYSQSKLAQVMFTFELAERLTANGESGVTVNALHPASLMDTKMVRQTFGRAMASVEEGAEATLRLIRDPELEGVTGRYFEELREARAHPQAYDPEARRRLWTLSEELTGVSAAVSE